jgi:prepilin peptidase CpaA
MNALQQQLIFAGSSLVCASIGSVHDIRERRIPNRLTGTAIVAGLVLHGIGAGWRGMGDSALAGLLGGGIFLMFYLAGGMAAGDVKLMTAVGCIVGLSALQSIVIATVIAGAVFALVVSLYHGRLRETFCNVRVLLVHHRRQGLTPHPDLNMANRGALRLPFALPVAAGCLFTFCNLAWGLRS